MAAHAVDQDAVTGEPWRFGGPRPLRGVSATYAHEVPIYEFRCRACGATFEEQRAMADAEVTATCPDGHTDTTRLLSVFAATGAASAPSAAGPGGGGGCCGGACGCG